MCAGWCLWQRALVAASMHSCGLTLCRVLVSNFSVNITAFERRGRVHQTVATALALWEAICGRLSQHISRLQLGRPAHGIGLAGADLHLSVPICRSEQEHPLAFPAAQ